MNTHIPNNPNFGIRAKLNPKLIIILLILLLITPIACQTTSAYQSLEATLSELSKTVTVEAGIESNPSPSATPLSSSPTIQQELDIYQFNQVLIDIYKRVSPGVVAIRTMTNNGGGIGSGFVYDKQGHILTNYHVVLGATELEVDFPSGLKVYGEIIATDLDSDLAVIKVEVAEDQLFPLTFGDSDSLEVGQLVVAIGNPFGLNGTMTLGIISAKGRTLASNRQTETGTFFSVGDIIQTDASINPGNSGGPLLNLDGEVVGLNRAIQTLGVTADGSPINSGIGFSISVNIIKRVVPVLIEKGRYDYPYLGITTLDELTLSQQEALGINYPTGAYITSVTPGSPADKAGLRGGTTPDNIFDIPKGGDLIIGVDDIPVRVFGEFLSYIMTHKSPGDKIQLTIIRDGKEMNIEVVLGKRPE